MPRFQIVEINRYVCAAGSCGQNVGLMAVGLDPAQRDHVITERQDEGKALAEARRWAMFPNDFGCVDAQGLLLPSWIQVCEVSRNGSVRRTIEVEAAGHGAHEARR